MAGPYAKYGSNVVAQAVEAGTHYCDITGVTLIGATSVTCCAWISRLCAQTRRVSRHIP
jgi:hypothetical protein